jgi:hypothetical protein
MVAKKHFNAETIYKTTTNEAGGANSHWRINTAMNEIGLLLRNEAPYQI